jgi:hypothetical protein
MRIALAASTALLLFLTGCGDADPEPDAAPPAANTDADADDGEQDDDGELGDARELLDERAVEGAGAQHLDFGETAQHGDVTVTVRSAEWADDEYQSDDEWEWVEAHCPSRLSRPCDALSPGPVLPTAIGAGWWTDWRRRSPRRGASGSTVRNSRRTRWCMIRTARWTCGCTGR